MTETEDQENSLQLIRLDEAVAVGPEERQDQSGGILPEGNSVSLIGVRMSRTDQISTVFSAAAELTWEFLEDSC